MSSASPFFTMENTSANSPMSDSARDEGHHCLLGVLGDVDTPGSRSVSDVPCMHREPNAREERYRISLCPLFCIKVRSLLGY